MHPEPMQLSTMKVLSRRFLSDEQRLYALENHKKTWYYWIQQDYNTKSDQSLL